MNEFQRVFQGTAFTSKSKQEVIALEQHLFCINAAGIIEQVVAPTDPSYDEIVRTYQANGKLQLLEEGQYILPGYVDLHVHAPQWGQCGTALDEPLYKWLDTYTFPIESKFADIDYAQKVYSHLVDTLLANGTTTALYFATVHKEASVLLAEICAKKGQRGLVGKVVMDG